MIQSTFDDFDAFADTVRDAEMDMVMCNRKRSTWDLLFMSIDGVHFQVGDLGSGNLVRGLGEKDRYVVYTPLSGDFESVLNGATVRKGQFAIIPPNEVFTLRTLDAHYWLSFSFPFHRVTHICRDNEVSHEPAGRVCRVENNHSAVAGKIARAVDEIVGAAASCANFESSPAAVSASEALVQTFLPVLGSPSISPATTGGRKRLPRQEIIDRAVAVAEADSLDPPSVGKMADAAGVSERSLRNVFSDYMGMGPVRFLQLRQFRKINRELAAAGPDETTVTDVLVANGVWQWGRFAAGYRQVFGEMPSETLRKSRSPASLPSVIAATLT